MVSTRPTALSAQHGLKLAKYSFGVGDRFARQARAQLKACMMAQARGVEVIPVWNKSNREHVIVGSSPEEVRIAAEEAVQTLGWRKSFHVDADHITLQTVDRFLDSSDFFTLDVADAIGKPVSSSEVDSFVAAHQELLTRVNMDADFSSVELNRDSLIEISSKYLVAIKQAAAIYRHIAERKGQGNVIVEVSMDETDSPLTPAELLVILAALADHGVAVQTIAPKFSGRFNKGIDYVGDTSRFDREFRSDLAVIAHAIRVYGLPTGLKLSIHSGSDKFSLYPLIHAALKDTGAGIHVKTAGTTWLEELIGLAEAGEEGLELASEIYSGAYLHREELCAPYAAVIDIDVARLPSPAEVNRWTSEQYVNALRHNRECREYNPSFRQLLHVGYKVAAKRGQRYLDMLDACEDSISRNVTANLYDRHIEPIFIGNQPEPGCC
jgi:tagaturonate epimerase